MTDFESIYRAPYIAPPPDDTLELIIRELVTLKLLGLAVPQQAIEVAEATA